MARSSQSLLLNYRQRNGRLFFRVADSPDYELLIRELKRRIPARARQFSSQTLEWCVNLEYRESIEELFSGKVDLTQKQISRKASHTESEGAGGQIIWLLLVLTVIFTAGALFWARQPDSIEAIAAPTAVPTIETAIVTQPQTKEATVNSTANFRGGPGLLFAVTAQAEHGEQVMPIARAQDADGYWWLKIQDDRWVRSDLVVSSAPGEFPLDLSLIPVESTN